MQERKTRRIAQKCSFRGQKISGADFSGCDIRGLDFTNATLIGANFVRAKAGQAPQWLLLIVLAASLLSLLAGYVSAYAGGVIGSLMVIEDGQPLTFWSSIIALLILVIFVLIASRKGLGVALGTFSLIVAFTIVLLAGLGKVSATVAAIVQAVAIAGIIAGTSLAGIAMSVLQVVIGRSALTIFSIAFVLGSFYGGWEGVKRGTNRYLTQGLPIAALIACILLGLSVYIGRRAAKQDKKYWFIFDIARKFTALGGTRFRGANLTDADFSQANLGGVDFRNSILKRACWFQVKNLERSRLEETYLEDTQIRCLVTTKDGSSQHFEDLDLRGLNLKNANLKNAFFIGANLSESNLENSDLTGARLAKTQFYQANLSGACLTGAYIENWGISTDTNLEFIKCDYIYMRLPTDIDPDPCRKPDNRKEMFQDGDFTDFIAPIIKTLDLYFTQNVDLRKVANKFRTLDLFHYQGIDPSAAAIALRQVAEQHPEAELEVIALEGKGNDKIRLQTRVTRDTNRSDLYTEYFSRYRKLQSLSDSDLQAIIASMVERDERIQSLEDLLEIALKQPKFYVETYENQGEFILAQENKGNIGNIAISGNNNPFNAVQAGNDVALSQSNTQARVTNPKSETVFEALDRLKRKIIEIDTIEDTEKEMLAIPIQRLEDELQNEQPDQGKLEHAVAVLRKLVDGTAVLEELVRKVADLTVAMAS